MLFAIEKKALKFLVNKWVRVLLFLNAFAQSLKKIAISLKKLRYKTSRT